MSAKGPEAPGKKPSRRRKAPIDRSAYPLTPGSFTGSPADAMAAILNVARAMGEAAAEKDFEDEQRAISTRL